MAASFKIPAQSLFMLCNLWNIKSMIENETLNVAFVELALLLNTWKSSLISG
jgi:hypothetical protein